MNGTRSTLNALVVVMLATVALTTGCRSIQVITKPYTTGKILVLPPRNAVQQGKPHPVAAESGRLLQNQLLTRFASTGFEAVATNSEKFNHKTMAAKEDALAEGKKLGADYVLQVALGEFLDAAPMTFRADYVHVDRAVMYAVDSGEAVWELAQQLYFEKTNIGGFTLLLGHHAQAIIGSINEHKQ